MIAKIITYLYRLKARDKIPRVPRMFSSAYQTITPDESRVMARYGIRSPSGLRVAMKKHGVNDLESLVAILEHHKPQRRVWNRLRIAMIRLTGGLPYHPFEREIKKIGSKRGKNLELEHRLKRVKTEFSK